MCHQRLENQAEALALYGVESIRLTEAALAAQRSATMAAAVQEQVEHTQADLEQYVPGRAPVNGRVSH